MVGWNAKREAKHVERAIRTVPINEIASAVHSDERTGLWCIVDGKVEWVPVTGGRTETTWDDAVELALYYRYLLTIPERVHDTHESAVAFVRAKLEGPSQCGSAS
jgi:hypothetical protein